VLFKTNSAYSLTAPALSLAIAMGAGSACTPSLSSQNTGAVFSANTQLSASTSTTTAINLAGYVHPAYLLQCSAGATACPNLTQVRTTLAALDIQASSASDLTANAQFAESTFVYAPSVAAIDPAHILVTDGLTVQIYSYSNSPPTLTLQTAFQNVGSAQENTALTSSTLASCLLINQAVIFDVVDGATAPVSPPKLGVTPVPIVKAGLTIPIAGESH